MTLQQLRYVIRAADSRSMNEAAKALYISQPSLSGAIKELEKEIGIELFKRSSHGTVLTPEGEEFLGCPLRSFELDGITFTPNYNFFFCQLINVLLDIHNFFSLSAAKWYQPSTLHFD